MAQKRPPAPNVFVRPAMADNPQVLLAQAMQMLQSGRAPDAAALCRRILQSHPRIAPAHYFLGLIAAGAGRYEEAVDALRASLATDPAQPAALNNLGVALRRLKRFAEAADAFAGAVALRPDYAEAHANRGNAWRDLGRPAEALASYDQALALRPDLAEAHNGRGNALVDLQRPADALAAFDRAIALRPDHAESHSNRARALLALGDAAAALAAAERSLAANPANPEALVNRGNALAALRRRADALASFDAALRLDPRHATALANRGGVLLEANRPEDALAAYDQALAIDRAFAEALEGRAIAATRARRLDDAAATYARLAELAPAYPYVAGSVLHARMLCADWTGIDALQDTIRAGLAAGARVAEPFGYQGIARSEADLKACAEVFARHEFPARAPLVTRSVPAADGRITIGYLCGEFREHATTILLCGVFERHRKDRFRLIAFDNGGADDSDYRRRVEAAFDEIVDISRLGDREAAEAIRQRGVDVLVNLNGYYGEHRLGVFAWRPSPVQVNYLGFPGTLGAPYVDYIVADRVVLPEASRAHYTEQVAWLPHAYQANDDQREVDPQPVTRAEFGLPDDAFVFCCFNNAYKITPGTFASWMRILQQVPRGVLWLLRDAPAVEQRLRREADALGVAPARLVFAERLPPARHLARHRVADLFLDTLPYNAHTTASDALWAGLPVLTCMGTTFPGRVAASLLQALGLPELVAGDMARYEALAVELASGPERLAALRERLAQARRSSPLFDTARTTRALEDLYASMVGRNRQGLPPAPLGA